MFDPRVNEFRIRNSRLLSFFFLPRISDSLASRYRIQGSENAALPLSSVSENVIGLIGVGRSNVSPMVGHVFGATVQLSAATRDFPVHGHLHASQTPKGCSFTQPPSVGWMGGWHEILPVAWVKSRDGGWREEGGRRWSGKRRCASSKTNIRLERLESFSGWKPALENRHETL